jgi:hypothetical protein
MTPTPDVGALKPCPFCGNPPATGHSSDGHTWIGCETKGCGLAETYMSKDHDAVLAMWNRRDATAFQALEAKLAEAEKRNQGLSDAELDVVEAAQDWAFAQEGSKYGPMQHEVRRAEKALMDAMSNLAAENDGRWRRP